ncbi:polysaccharide deacetylase family protein [Silvimonas soli]|uniref:polysaccharide deacetylase family protein n=1 Tax=Silvimonas soli TaxID=2980100 RepID=UPI0024B38D8A|nr:polysaccharide deacetylase family protein [Silvimonas soli]
MNSPSHASARTVPVLMYHHVSPSPGPITLSPEHFDAQMRWLAQAGYTTLDTAAFAGFLAGEPVPEKSVLLTFDDGYLDNYVYGHAALQRHGLNAVMFLVTGWMGDGPVRATQGQGALPATPAHGECEQLIASGHADDVIVRWSEIETMRAAGTFEFHSHTHTHTRWDKQCAYASEKRERLAQDIAQSRSRLQQRLGGVSDHLCWPQGYFDADYQQVAREAGFKYLYTTRDDARNVPGTDPARICRIGEKGRGADWLAQKLWLVRNPLLGGAHYWLKQHQKKKR